MEFDVVVVGGGPAGLATAIRLRQLAAQRGTDVSVACWKRAPSLAHISFRVPMDPRALTELIPDWKDKGAPLNQPVTDDAMLFLSATGSFRMPNFAVPKTFRNHGNYIVGLGNVVRWLAQQAEALGIEIFPGFPAAEILYDENGAVKDVATCNMGVGKDGQPTEKFQLGMELHAKYTIFAEGCRGHLGRQLIDRLKLAEDRDLQAYGIGVKELWEVTDNRHEPGLVVHTAGWPLANDTYGGAFLYHMENNLVALGFIMGLDYKNPYLSPFEEMQCWKTHRNIRGYLEGGKRVSYGARAIAAGGLLSLPKQIFPGGALVDDDAGYLNAARIKGSHAALKSGMLAAEAAYNAIVAGRQHDELTAYPEAFERRWLHRELNQSRNFKPWFKKGLWPATIMTGIEHTLLRGHVPWTLHRRKPDYASLEPTAKHKPIAYPKPDGKLTFDRLSSVFISNMNHAEDQPPHLTLKDASVPA